MSGRRLLTLLVVLAAIGIPAGLLQALCVGKSCDAGPAPPARVPFCALPDELRRAIADGYYEGRSPDVLGVTADVAVFSEAGGTGLRAPWPSTETPTSSSVPIAFTGAGVSSATRIPAGVTLDRIAPTVAEILGLEREHSDVRSGTPIEGVGETVEPPRLVLLIGWKGVGGRELEDRPDDWPFLASALEEGTGTLAGRTGSLPLDPAATLTTIGTGGLPGQHGITGSFVRSDEGAVVPAFGDGAPIHVIATLADDLEDADPGTLVGLIATDATDRGLVGGAWYPGQDPVDVVIGHSPAAPLAVDVMLETGYGADATPDVLGVVLDGSIRRIDRLTRSIVAAARRAAEDSVLVVVAGTGSVGSTVLATPDRSLIDAVEAAVPGPDPVVAATVPGGMFLAQDVLRDAGVTGQAAAAAMASVTGRDGRTMMADAFQGFAVSFERYC